MDSNTNMTEYEFWASKGTDLCTNNCSNCTCTTSINQTCNCGPDDVCPKCLDSVLAEFEDNVRQGSVGKLGIDEAIEIKQRMMHILQGTQAAKQLAVEVAWLKMMREKQLF